MSMFRLCLFLVSLEICFIAQAAGKKVSVFCLFGVFVCVFVVGGGGERVNRVNS